MGTNGSWTWINWRGCVVGRSTGKKVQAAQSDSDDCRENAHNFGLTFCIRYWVSLFLVPI